MSFFMQSLGYLSAQWVLYFCFNFVQVVSTKRLQSGATPLAVLLRSELVTVSHGQFWSNRPNWQPHPQREAEGTS